MENSTNPLSNGSWNRHESRGSINPSFLPYLMSNDLPPQQIVYNASIGRMSPLHALKDTKRSIKLLQIILEALERRSASLQEEISHYDSILSPIRQLPDHILMEIFHHCLPTKRYPIVSTSESPLLLTLVCKKWRTIAFRGPLLWNKVHIQYHQSYTFDNAIMANFSAWEVYNTSLEAWFRRSKSVPLSVSFHPRRVTGSENRIPDGILTSTAHQTFCLIAQQAERISTVEIVAPMDTLACIQSLMRGRQIDAFPLLQCFRLSITYPMSTIIVMRNFRLSLFISSPLLRQISIDSIHESATMDVIRKDFPLLTLTELSLHMKLLPHQIAEIVAGAPLLKILSVHTSPYTPSRKSNKPMWHLPSLRTLHIQGPCLSAANLCSFISAPTLTSLVLDLHSYTLFGTNEYDRAVSSSDTPWPMQDIVSLLRRTSLSTLTFDPSNLSSAEIQAILQATPSITTLIVDQTFNTEWGSSYKNLIKDAQLTSRDRHAFYEEKAHVLCPLLKQERWTVVDSLAVCSSLLIEPLLPALVSFTIIEDIESQTHILPDANTLVQFLKSRIHSDSEHSGTASLQHVKLVLRERPDDDVNVLSCIDRHAATVGRGVDQDIVVDITYRGCASGKYTSGVVMCGIPEMPPQLDDEQLMCTLLEDGPTWHAHADGYL